MKDLNNLAILGQLPRFRDFALHVNLPKSPDKDNFLKLISKVLESKRFTNGGPLTEQLEHKIATYLGVGECVLVANGTLGLQLVTRALNLKGEVIVPAFTFIATANALKWEGITPVFCDIDLNTHNICLDHCKQLITPKTSAILGVHLWGRSCNSRELKKLAEKHKISLFFDASHAFACGKNKQLIGSFGEAEIFSLHATKAFHTGEGGAITTNNKYLANKLRKMRSFGFVDYDKTECLGINAKISELHAALGLANLDSLANSLKVSRNNHQLYSSLLSNIEGIDILQYDQPHNFHYIVAEIQENAPLNRNELLQVLIHENVIARRYFYPGCHRMAPFGSTTSYSPLKNTDKLAEKILILPGGSNLSSEEVEGVCETIISGFKNSEKIKLKLSENY